MGDIALLTQQHIKHDKCWTVPAYSLPKMCIACVIFRLEKKGETDICCKKILEELLAILSSGSGKSFITLSSDSRVLQHLANILFDILESSYSKTVKQISIQVIVSLSTLRATIGITVIQRGVQWIMSAHNYSCSLDHVILVGKLLHMNSELCQQLIRCHGNFIDHLISGLSYPDETIKTECAYVLNQMITEYKSLPLCTVKKLCSTIVSMPTAMKSHDCTVNMLGLIKRLLGNSTHVQFLVQTDHDKKGLNLASLLKRVLLSTDESLQIAAVQCVKTVLDQCPDFCKDLLVADIAEFLFEGLMSKNETYLRSVFEVLSKMADNEEFYTLYHSIYGIEALVSNIEAITKWQCNDLAIIGYDLLSKILSNQPISIPLITSSPLLSQLFTLIHHGLSRDVITINMAACSLFVNLLRLHHMMVSYPVQSLLQLLAHCARILEPLADEDSVSNDNVCDPNLYALFAQGLAAMYCTLCLCTVDGNSVTVSSAINAEEKEEIVQFLLQTFDQVYLPSFLLHHDEFNISDDDSDCNKNFFKLASHMLQHCPRNNLTQKLAYCGLIQIGWQVKNKYCPQNRPQLLESVDEFMAVLCHHLTLTCGRDNGQQIKEMLKESLPEMSSLMDENLQYLSQRYCETDSVMEKKQVATICIIYWAFLHDDQIVQPFCLLTALSDYICNHPDTHLLPAVTLQQVVFLFAACSQLSAPHEPVYNYQTASQVLCRAMLRVSKPESLFIPHPALWNWVLQQPSLKPVSTNWMIELLKMMSKDNAQLCAFHSVWKSPTEYFASLGECTATVMDVLLDLICSGNDDDMITLALDVLSSIIKEIHPVTTKHSSYFVVMESVQKRFLATHRLVPLPDEGSIALLKLLTHFCAISPSVHIDIKVVYQVTNSILRSTTNDSALLLANLNLLYVVLHSSTTFSSQVTAFLVGNVKFVEKLSSLIPITTSSQAYNLVSGLAMLILAILMTNNKQITNSSIVISIPSLLAALNGQPAIVQVSALYLWQAVIKQNGQNDVFSLSCSSGHTMYHNIQMLLFLMQNAIVKETSSVRESAVICFGELLHYAHHINIDKCFYQQQWNTIIAEYILNLYCNEVAPTAFIKYFAIILHHKVEPDTVPVKRIAQFVYRQLMISSNEKDLTEQAEIIYAACFGEIVIRGSQNLSWEEWKHSGSLLLCAAKQSVTECHDSTKYNSNYIVIDGVTVCESRLWPTQEEHFKGALRAYILMFESNTELD